MADDFDDGDFTVGARHAVLPPQRTHARTHARTRLVAQFFFGDVVVDRRVVGRNSQHVRRPRLTRSRAARPPCPRAMLCCSRRRRSGCAALAKRCWEGGPSRAWSVLYVRAPGESLTATASLAQSDMHAGPSRSVLSTAGQKTPMIRSRSAQKAGASRGRF
jgi:hypothetical protein